MAETFLTVWRKIEQMPSGEETLPWLYAIAHRVVMHQWRSSFRRRRLNNRLASLGVVSIRTPEEYIVAGDESHRVMEATSRLRATDQEILRLSLWEELAHAEIAQVLGMRTEAVRKRFSRAVKNLTREFNKIESKQANSALLRKEVGGGH